MYFRPPVVLAQFGRLIRPSRLAQTRVFEPRCEHCEHFHQCLLHEYNIGNFYFY